MAEPRANDASRLGDEMHALVRELYPICRSITGDGVRKTLGILARFVPLRVEEVATGTPVLDWMVPREWNIRDAWIADATGTRVVDFKASNLHVVSYSVPTRTRLSLEALRPHLHTLPDRPHWIPYRTSYYEESWGFCLSQSQLDALVPGEYEVCIDSSLAPGHLSYGELFLPGASEQEILVSTHVCHPSLCDDNLSAIAVSVFLARELAARPRRRYGVRFLYVPGTIGAITWLARNRERASLIRHGLTLTCLGDRHRFTYKRTLAGNTEIDRVVPLVLRQSGLEHDVIDFFPYGYDERQYNSPGFRLPVGSLMRGRHGQFPEYHTSADDPGFVSPDRLAESLAVCGRVVDVLEANRVYRNLNPWGEPQLGRRGLYRALGGENVPGLELAMLWMLCLADGSRSLLDIAERAGLEIEQLSRATELLLRHGMLEVLE